MRILFVMRLWDFLKSLSGTEEFVNSRGDMTNLLCHYVR